MKYQLAIERNKIQNQDSGFIYPVHSSPLTGYTNSNTWKTAEISRDTSLEIAIFHKNALEFFFSSFFEFRWLKRQQRLLRYFDLPRVLLFFPLSSLVTHRKRGERNLFHGGRVYASQDGEIVSQYPGAMKEIQLTEKKKSYFTAELSDIQDEKTAFKEKRIVWKKPSLVNVHKLF